MEIICPKCHNLMEVITYGSWHHVYPDPHYISLQVVWTSMMHPDWIYLESGRHREVWKLPSGNVIKIPIGDAGKTANEYEANCYASPNSTKHMYSGGEKWQYARCKLIPGTSILVMEFINESNVSYSKLPSWCHEVDCEQVGYTKKGKLVAYDFAEI